MIREAFLESLTCKPQRKLGSDLYVSDLGYHPAKAMRRILKGEQSAFSTKTLEVMDMGNAFEADTVQKIGMRLGWCLTQFPLFDQVWSGYADIVLNHGRPGHKPTIVEHKATGDKWWAYKGCPYRPPHICQLWMYGQLYEATYGVKPELILYYRAWGHYAELWLEEGKSGKIHVGGLVDDQPYQAVTEFSPAHERTVLEKAFWDRVIPPGDPDNMDYLVEG